MAAWANLKTLGLVNPLQALEKRNPSYCQRYAGRQDEFGYRIETYARWEPIFRFLYEDYFKVDCRGIDNIPAQGSALLVGNHSGLLPLDAGMITMAMSNMPEGPRRIRYLVTDWFFTVPTLSEWIQETGQVRATLANAKTLVDKNELVGIYPEGLRGVGKPFAERYRLIDFHPGFVQLAISTQRPIIPVATVGGDEIYPHFVNLKSVAQLLKMPFFPLTLTFPWVPFPAMYIPLPVRWLVNIHKPINLGYPPEKASDRKLSLKIAREIQYTIQSDLNRLLRERKSLFTGWEEPQPNNQQEPEIK